MAVHMASKIYVYKYEGYHYFNVPRHSRFKIEIARFYQLSPSTG